jgi:hypothetical protein
MNISVCLFKNSMNFAIKTAANVETFFIPPNFFIYFFYKKNCCLQQHAESQIIDFLINVKLSALC